MAFKERQFPIQAGFSSSGGPQRKTQIVTTANGREQRNQQWSQSRRLWDIGLAVRANEEAELVTAFFEEMRGRLYGFRFLDPLDFKSCAVNNDPTAYDQVIGMGDGATTTYQLVKTYGTDGAYVRTIAKPQLGVVIAIDGVQLMGSDFSVDVTTGLVTLATAPVAGALVTAGYKFDVPARFDTDILSIVVDGHDLISSASIPVIEIFL